MSAGFYALFGVGVGFLSSMVGIGGGMFLVPALSLYAGVPVHEAIATSLVAIVGTSGSAGIGYRRSDLVNPRLGVSLLTTTVVGAVLGGVLGTVLNTDVLRGVFGGVMGAIALYLLFARPPERDGPGGEAEGLLGASFRDERTGEVVGYGVRRTPLGVTLAFLAGGLSGLLGVGGGVVHVPTMRLGMAVPMKAAVATSTFMLGAAASAGALIYYWQGFVDPFLTAPIVLGILAGAILGSRLAARARGSRLLFLLAVVILLLSIQMLLAAFGIELVDRG